MKIIKAVIAFIGILWGGMSGGQGKQAGKSPRRFGIPLIGSMFALSVGWRWKYLAFLLFIPILSIGYGVDSILGNICFHNETMIRVIYALLLSTPFAVFGALRWSMAAGLLVVAFQIQAGSLGYTPWFGDFLVEDIVRYSILAGLIIFNVLKDSTE
jgi:hypothetical protein